jgi:hypothetical protein
MSELSDEQLDQAVAQLAKIRQPSRDLWTGIDHAIEQQQMRQPLRHQGYQKWSAMAAGVGILGLTVWLSTSSIKGIEPGPEGQSAPLSYVASMSQDFAKQKQVLLTKYQDQPSASDNWREQLQQLDEAAAAIKKVLDREPANAQLIKMLQQTYQQQLDLIIAVNKSPWQQI